MKNQILEWIQEEPEVQKILDQSDSVGNLSLMEEALLLQAAFKKSNQNLIVVKKDIYQCQQLYKCLSPLVDEVLFFVMEESLRVQAIASSPEDKNELIYTLSQLYSDKKHIVICNTAGFLRYLPDPKFFQQNILTLKTDQKRNRDELIFQLNRMGYAHIHYVDRPCTFASRGGIVDIYALQYEHPIRVEFFDTEIESIRFFDEQTQRTIEVVDEVCIGPATDLLFRDDQIEEIQSQVKELLHKEKKRLDTEDYTYLEEEIEGHMRSLESYDTENILYFYFPYVQTYQLMDYIKGLVILSPVEDVLAMEKKLNEDNIAYIQERVQDHISLPKYTLFYDIYRLKEKYDFCEIHNFSSNIGSFEPVERAVLPLVEQLKKVDKTKQIHLALEEKERQLVEGCLADNEIQLSYDLIEPIFAQGFIYRDHMILTSRELFVQSRQKKRYYKTFKEGQILENVLELDPNDYVVHEQYGIGQYLGIVTKENQGKKLDYLHIVYRGGDELFVPLSQFHLVRKYVSKEGAGVKLSQLGSKAWQKTKEKVNQRVEEVAARLVELYALRNEDIGYAYPEDDDLQREFEESFEYDPTPDQIKAIQEIKAEMEKPKPMDHLLCGDVGFGKTEVAMCAAFKVISSGKQVAFLCPTTILSMQHYQTLSNRFAYTGANIALVNRFVSQKEVSNIKKGLEKGTIDIVVGTHRLLNKSFKFKDLGFLVIDEEQRFGVEHKEKIKEMKNTIDVLSLSATPIPRTMQMSLIGVRTISQLNTPPAKRHPIQTYILEKRGSVVQEIIARELARGGQVFYLFNRISQIHITANKISNWFPDAKVAVAHGKMEKETIEQTMLEFSQGKYDILVCTTIIETGLDISNANTIIIEDADKFGLSQLYQIRGRVGRREKIGYCYLMIQPDKQLSEEAHKRLKSIKEFTRLGSGYKIAMRDLTIRGAGDLLGPQQAGFINQVGLDLYLELLANAIAKHKGEKIEKKTLEKKAKIGFNGHIPQNFTENDGDKLSIYQKVGKIYSFDELESFYDRIVDLFGTIPKEVEAIFDQRRYDLFVNLSGVESLLEQDKKYTIVFTSAYTKTCNGVKLFETLNSISKKIKLTLKNGKIHIFVPQNRKLLMTTLKELREKELCELTNS